MARAAKDKNLKRRTLTNLYNQRPTWLKPRPTSGSIGACSPRRDDEKTAMRKGIEVFREHFSDCEDRYLLTGGAPCHLLMSATPAGGDAA
jgi:hypothetical protein